MLPTQHFHPPFQSIIEQNHVSTTIPLYTNFKTFSVKLFLDKKKCPFPEKFFHFISNFFTVLIQRKIIKILYYIKKRRQKSKGFS
jgi:hypothetical protein